MNLKASTSVLTIRGFCALKSPQRQIERLAHWKRLKWS